MKVAIPVFGARISPRLDCAVDFIIASTENGEVDDRRAASPPRGGPRALAKWLVALGVQRIICGGIDGRSAQLLEQNGIAVCAWVSGELDDALKAFAEGRLEPMMMMGPGGKCCGRWQFRRGQGGRGRGRGR